MDNIQVNFKSDPGLIEKLDAIAQAEGRSRSGQLRQMIVEAWREFAANPRNAELARGEYEGDGLA